MKNLKLRLLGQIRDKYAIIYPYIGALFKARFFQNNVKYAKFAKKFYLSSIESN
jgi:hypothetical protein